MQNKLPKIIRRHLILEELVEVKEVIESINEKLGLDNNVTYKYTVSQCDNTKDSNFGLYRYQIMAQHNGERVYDIYFNVPPQEAQKRVSQIKTDSYKILSYMSYQPLLFFSQNLKIKKISL